MKTDQELLQEIERELEWDPSARCEQVTVEVVESSVTLRGVVGAYSERGAAERATLRIAGVLEVDNQIALAPAAEADPDDAAIGEALQRKLDTHAELRHHAVHASVDERWLTLDNRRMAMVEDADVRNYRPLFVIDDHGVMRYEDPAPAAAVSRPDSAQAMAGNLVTATGMSSNSN